MSNDKREDAIFSDVEQQEIIDPSPEKSDFEKICQSNQPNDLHQKKSIFQKLANPKIFFPTVYLFFEFWFCVFLNLFSNLLNLKSPNLTFADSKHFHLFYDFKFIDYDFHRYLLDYVCLIRSVKNPAKGVGNDQQVLVFNDRINNYFDFFAERNFQPHPNILIHLRFFGGLILWVRNFLIMNLPESPVDRFSQNLASIQHRG